MSATISSRERDELHKSIWAVADDLRGSVDGWDFKQYILGTMFYRYISERITNYINEGEYAAGNTDFDYKVMSDEEAEAAREGLVEEIGFFILPSELFCNVRSRAKNDENLNETLENVFKHIEGSAAGHESEGALKGLFTDFDVNSNKLGATVEKRNQKTNIHNNQVQVINQYVVTEGKHDNRYDVTILVNGLPLIHIELKRRGVAIREAFHQINRYQRDSFWAGSGLFEYVQIFVISNGTNTKYYSNSTRYNAIKEGEAGNARRQKTSNSFEFTSFWADGKNRIIPDLIDFTKTFFARHTILNILTRYCVFTAENMLLVMRPYQIAATERILNRIEITNNYKKYGTYGTINGGGYIWHGS